MLLTLVEVWFSARWPAGRLRSVWVVYWVCLFGLMHVPREHLPTVRVSHLDKVVHVTGYALLGLLGGGYAQRRGAATGAGWYIKWLAVYAVYAAFDELTQPMVGRSATLADWSADIVGVVIAFAVIRFGRDGPSVSGGSG